MQLYRYMPPLPLGLLVLERYGSWSAFARHVGITRQAVAQYFGPNPKYWSDPSLPIGARMAAALGLTLDEFSARLEAERKQRLKELKEVQSA